MAVATTFWTDVLAIPLKIFAFFYLPVVFLSIAASFAGLHMILLLIAGYELHLPEAEEIDERDNPFMCATSLTVVVSIGAILWSIFYSDSVTEERWYWESFLLMAQFFCGTLLTELCVLIPFALCSLVVIFTQCCKRRKEKVSSVSKTEGGSQEV
jgi:hypothetical protein